MRVDVQTLSTLNITDVYTVCNLFVLSQDTHVWHSRLKTHLLTQHCKQKHSRLSQISSPTDYTMDSKRKNTFAIRVVPHRSRSQYSFKKSIAKPQQKQSPEQVDVFKFRRLVYIKTQRRLPRTQADQQLQSWP